MMAEVEVLNPGLFSTVQDSGRFGYQKYGVPISGVMDSYAFKIANLLLGNPENAAVLEITLMGPKLQFSSPANICITGADLSPTINKNKIGLNKVIKIGSGDILEFGKRQSGCRAYLGISGGFLTEEIMDSKSWYSDLTRSYRLEKGMHLAYEMKKMKSDNTFSSIKINTTYLEGNIIEAYPGPEFSRLSKKQVHELQEARFHISEKSNRMAIQLNEDLPNDLDPIITSPVIPGTIQQTPAGNLIILARDCQITGGYPRVLQLSEIGLQVLAQKAPGMEIGFKILRE